MKKISSAIRIFYVLLRDAGISFLLGVGMKGVVFNLLEQVVVASLGDDAWDHLLADANLKGAYSSLGSYPDRDMQALVQVLASAQQKSEQEVLQWFGRAAMPLLFQRYPRFFAAHTEVRAFVLSVNEFIHPEVRKIYPGAEVPRFVFRQEGDDGLLMEYRSPRKLCALAHGFIEGAADHYQEAVVVTHLQCMHRGDALCVCRISSTTRRWRTA